MIRRPLHCPLCTGTELSARADQSRITYRCKSAPCGFVFTVNRSALQAHDLHAPAPRGRSAETTRPVEFRRTVRIYTGKST
jgi:hypothetical protein